MKHAVLFVRKVYLFASVSAEFITWEFISIPSANLRNFAMVLNYSLSLK